MRDAPRADAEFVFGGDGRDPPSTRPQAWKLPPPTLCGFIPGTCWGPRIGGVAGTERGAGAPLDVCVISERPIDRSDVILRARPLGGLLMVDAGEADDKIIAVLDGDAVWGDAKDLADLPRALVDRLRHYFLTYKLVPGSGEQPVDIAKVYDRAEAVKVLQASIDDYAERFGA